MREQPPEFEVTGDEVQREADHVQRTVAELVAATISHGSMRTSLHTVTGSERGTRRSFRMRLVADTGYADPEPAPASTMSLPHPVREPAGVSVTCVEGRQQSDSARKTATTLAVSSRRLGVLLAGVLFGLAAPADAQQSNSSPSGAPTVTGTPVVGQTLTAAKGTLADADGLPGDSELAWQWVRQDDAAGTDAADIAAATGTTYVLTVADAGAWVTVKVAYTDGGGSDEEVAAVAVGPVRAPPPAPANLRESARAADGLVVAWDAPANTGRPAISHYDLRYRTPPGSGAWSDGSQDVDAAATSATWAA